MVRDMPDDLDEDEDVPRGYSKEPQGLESGPKEPPALNARQEKFARYLALGKSQNDAAALAGYSGHAANASRLANLAAVKQRVEEIRQEVRGISRLRVEAAAAERDRVSTEQKIDLAYFVNELKVNLEQARANGNIDHANKSLKLMMELFGFGAGSGTGSSKDGQGNGTANAPTEVKVSILNQLTGHSHGVDGTDPAPRTVVVEGDATVSRENLRDERALPTAGSPLDLIEQLAERVSGETPRTGA